jgi:S-adenosylmethionine:tRNA ribosyltransferase-isomerase
MLKMNSGNLSDKIKSIKIEDYKYELKDERIAKFPVVPRDSSKLLLYNGGQISETSFRNIADYLDEGSLLVYNNTKVIHARLIFFKETGAKIEIFCLEPISPADYAQNFQSQQSCEWLCLVGNLKKWKTGTLERTLKVNDKEVKFSAELIETIEKAHIIKFRWSSDNADDKILFSDLIETAGQLPIPPYLNRDTVESDEVTYQTVFSKIEGSVAAPTAGLHFTEEVLAAIDKKGITRSEVTLHVGAGTFQPVLSQQMLGHTMHSEFISVDRDFLSLLKTSLGHVTAVGTTSVRTLESLYWFGYKIITNQGSCPEEWTLDQWFAYEQMSDDQKHNLVSEISTHDALNAIIYYLDANHTDTFTASTRLLIAPGYVFHVVDTMITNFHQPKSTLLLLVSAFIGDEKWRDIYSYALDHDFRFLSYGDSSLLKICK